MKKKTMKTDNKKTMKTENHEALVVSIGVEKLELDADSP